MIIKKITLKNIRSYENAEIVFPQGSTLLAGDIGSGKTSVLLGIEFALFGLQPGQKGASLLRSSAKDGQVSLEIEVDGKQITIFRALKRGKSISQEDASITIDNETREMSVTELKNLVLELLDYPQEFIKKSNMLYRFTVYTPQEEMKQIILESSDARLDTLRHVFGIDKYKRIKENAEIVRLKLKEEIKSKEGMIADLEEKKARKQARVSDIEKLKIDITELGTSLAKLVEKRRQAESGLLETQAKIDEKKKLENEIDKARVGVSGKREMLSSLAKEEERIKNLLQETEKIKFDAGELASLEKAIEELKKEQDSGNKQFMEVSSQISSINSQALEYEKQRTNILKIDLCPTCLQNVDSSYKANVLNKFETDISTSKRRVSELNEEKIRLSLGIESVRKKINDLDSIISDLKLARIKLEGINEKKARVLEIEKQKFLVSSDMLMLEKHIGNLKSIVLDLSRYDSIHKTKSLELDEAKKHERLAEISLEKVKRETELVLKEISELDREIEKKEELKKRLVYLLSLQDWLTSSFLDIISFTEVSVMMKLKEQFSKLFNEWFNILVPEIFTVRLDDSFTPIIEQQDYEIDYSFLSGGERTAVALAYRLALNQTINSLLSRIKTKDIVILDEPTDGFSEQQLDKMRDVLGQLKVKQLILVSHESKIESFVENIIKFRKEAGVTKVEI